MVNYLVSVDSETKELPDSVKDALPFNPQTVVDARVDDGSVFLIKDNEEEIPLGDFTGPAGPNTVPTAAAVVNVIQTDANAIEAVEGIAEGVATSAAAAAVSPIQTTINGRLSEASLAQVFATAGSVVRPLVRRTQATTTVLATGTAASGTGTINATDTSDFAVGSSSVRLTSGGTGSYRFWQIATAVTDFTALTPRIIFKVPDYTNMNELSIYLGDTAMTNYFKANLAELAARDTQRFSKVGEWIVLDIARSDFTVGSGSPSWGTIQLARVYFTDKNATPATVQINSVGGVADPAALPNGAAIFTFDDADPTHWTVAKPYLDRIGAPGVAFPILSSIGGGGLSAAQLKAMRDLSGWEIGAHAKDTAEHTAGFAGLTEAQLISKYDYLKSTTAALGFTADNFAWPNGDSDLLAETVGRRYWSIARGTATGIQPATFTNAMRIKGVGDATLSNNVAKAKASKGVAVFVIHRLVSSGPVGTDYTIANFQAAVDACVAQGVPIMTFNELLKRTGAL
ncbi:hypothetical protein ACQ3HE_06600 [Plantibacter auratus]|uniref:hypothetical protein n=1 Tax=Plantibacter auratus TaxID=272914 RepID=UPI003D35492F